MQIDQFIFMEIAGQHYSSGADVPVIREGVDYRQKMLLSDSELRNGLKRLQTASLISKRGNKFFISESVVPSLPRTASGQLSSRRKDWDKLRKKLFEK